jgi:hypothetical protein
MLIAVAALAAACSRDIQNPEAVRQGVLDYLNQRKSQIGLDPSQMQIDVSSVSFQKDEARATVVFRPKTTADASPMTIGYLLDRKGNKWVVRPRGEGGANPHGGGTSTLPPNHPPMGAGEAPASGTLPPGHPPVNPPQGAKQ